MQAGKVLRFVFLPEFAPRIRALGQGGFAHVAYFMALVYRAARLLPANHPYLAAANIGKFGIRHVIAEAAGNLVFRKENIDQWLVFIALLVGMVVLFMQCVILLFSFLIQPAMAEMPGNFSDFFVTQNPVNDIAFVLLDRVFGVPDMFNSCVAINVPCFQGVTGVDRPTADGPFPWPFHTALHMMLQLYSIALMVIAVLIFSYFATVVIAETAQDGTPFGRRFNHVWAPLRMVIALGLLVPLSQGLNSGQYITLYAAKWGSGFATNGWLKFNQVLTDSYLGDKQDLVAMPKIPQVDKLVQFFLVEQACAKAYGLVTKDTDLEHQIGDINRGAWIVKDQFANPSALPWYDTDWNQALAFSDNKDIIIRFGPRDDNGGASTYYAYKGLTKPSCGEIILPVTSVTDPGALVLMEGYYELFKTLWIDMENSGETIARRAVSTVNEPGRAWIEDNKDDILLNYTGAVKQYTQNAIDEEIANGNFTDQNLLQLGWGGAAIWYNKIAQMNGAVTTAVFNMPKPNLWPDCMEQVLEQRRKQDKDVAGIDKFDPNMSGGFNAVFKPAYEQEIYAASYDAYKIFENEAGGRMPNPHIQTTGNVVIEIINMVFGSSGLFNMRQNADVHPLAQLSAAGKALLEASIRNVAWGGGIAAVLSFFPGNMAAVAGSLTTTFATVGITAGFALFYVVPFLPFIYFFFSVSGWVKGIFEAMVGVPLWALAHIRIDGEGLPGDAAMNGYFLIFEIFLRPILIVFGLLGSILIFGAMVKVLNETFDLIIQNLTGFDIDDQDNADWTDIEFYRGPIDEFFFTVIYVIIVYMIGVASFKMVDLVPNQILRWLGASVQTFNEMADNDAASHLMQTVAIGGGGTASQLAGAGGQAGSAVSGLAKAIRK